MKRIYTILFSLGLLIIAGTLMIIEGCAKESNPTVQLKAEIINKGSTSVAIYKLPSYPGGLMFHSWENQTDRLIMKGSNGEKIYYVYQLLGGGQWKLEKIFQQ
jgi:hypothetical protein